MFLSLVLALPVLPLLLVTDMGELRSGGEEAFQGSVAQKELVILAAIPSLPVFRAQEYRRGIYIMFVFTCSHCPCKLGKLQHLVCSLV